MHLYLKFCVAIDTVICAFVQKVILKFPSVKKVSRFLYVAVTICLLEELCRNLFFKNWMLAFLLIIIVFQHLCTVLKKINLFRARVLAIYHTPLLTLMLFTFYVSNITTIFVGIYFLCTFFELHSISAMPPSK